MRYVAEELSDTENWEDGSVRASRVLGPQVPDLTKKRRLVKACSSSPSDATDLSDPEHLARKSSPPSLESFAFRSKSLSGTAKPASRQKCIKDSRGSEFAKVSNSFEQSTPGHELEARRQDQAFQSARKGVMATEEDCNPGDPVSNSAWRTRRSRTGDAPDNSSRKALGRKAQVDDASPEAPGSFRGKRRGRRLVVDDSSDEDFDCRSPKKAKLSPVTYHSQRDVGDCVNDEAIARQLQHDEDEDASTGSKLEQT